jgi:hypothetical protein
LHLVGLSIHCIIAVSSLMMAVRSKNVAA